MTPLEIVDQGPDHTIARAGGVLFQRWTGQVEPSACAAALQTARAIREDRVDPGLIFIIHEQGAQMPATSERAVLTEVGKTMPETTKGCAFVFSGTGFAASAARSVLTGMQMLAKRPYPVKFFGTADEALAWSAIEGGFDVAELRAHVQALRGG